MTQTLIYLVHQPTPPRLSGGKSLIVSHLFRFFRHRETPGWNPKVEGSQVAKHPTGYCVQRIKNSGFPSYSILETIEKNGSLYLNFPHPKTSEFWTPEERLQKNWVSDPVDSIKVLGPISLSDLFWFFWSQVSFLFISVATKVFPHQTSPPFCYWKKKIQPQPLSFVTPGIHPQLREVVVPSPSFIFFFTLRIHKDPAMEGFVPVWRRGVCPQNRQFWGVRILRGRTC